MLIIAGSDTTSTTLIHLFYRLCSEKGLLQRLRDELDPLVKDADPITYAHILSAKLLHGCINETLRLHYPAPSGFFRKTPKEGIFIGDVPIPGDTVIQLPPYVMALSKQSWVSMEFRDLCSLLWHLQMRTYTRNAATLSPKDGLRAPRW